jgi:hypothetical protein
LDGQADQIKERTIGVEVFGRKPSYDTNEDHVVRTAAGELRKRLAIISVLGEVHEPSFATRRLNITTLVWPSYAGGVASRQSSSWIGIVQTDRSRQIIYGDKEGESVIGDLTCNVIQLRMHVEDQHVAFSYSIDGGASFLPVRAATPFSFSWWKASRPALFTFNTLSKGPFGSIDVDWVRSAPSDTMTTHDGKQMTAAQP